MIINQKVIILETKERDYEFNGTKGTSYKVRLLCGVDIFSCKTTKEILSILEPEKTYQAEISIRSVKEEPIFELISAKKVA